MRLVQLWERTVAKLRRTVGLRPPKKARLDDSVGEKKPPKPRAPKAKTNGSAGGSLKVMVRPCFCFLGLAQLHRHGKVKVVLHAWGYLMLLMQQLP